jgi:hypothetical protein
MVAPPAVLCAKAQPPRMGKGKGKAKAESSGDHLESMIREAGEAMPADICRKEGVYNLLCFCCPVPPLGTYHKLYVPKEDTALILTNLGKSIIDLHSEFGAWKAAGKKVICKAQTTHSQIFHQDKELNAVITQCVAWIMKDVPYGPTAEEVLVWIRNMPLEEQTRDASHGAVAVAEADEAIGDWRATKLGPLTLHTMMQGGPVNLGWSGTNRFAAIADTSGEPTPSKVANNA